MLDLACPHSGGLRCGDPFLGCLRKNLRPIEASLPARTGPVAFGFAGSFGFGFIKLDDGASCTGIRRQWMIRAVLLDKVWSSSTEETAGR